MTRDIRILPTAALTAVSRLAKYLAHSGLWMPLMVLVLVGIVGYRTGWVWPLTLCFVIGLGPWFAAARAFDDNVALRRELHRRDREAEAPQWQPPRDYGTQMLVDPSPPTLAERPDLYVVDPPSDDAPEADESWLAEITDGRWI